MDSPDEQSALVLVGSGETVTADEWWEYLHRLRAESLAAGWSPETVDADFAGAADDVVLCDAAGREWRCDSSGWTWRDGTMRVPGQPVGPLSVAFVVFDEPGPADLGTISPIVAQAEADLASLDATAGDVIGAPPPAHQVVGGAFAATHRAPAAGMRTWPEAGAAVPGPSLDPHLPVQVVSTWGSWSQIVCENGWRAWVDGRLLVDAADPGPLAPPAPPTSGTSVASSQTPTGRWSRPSTATWRVTVGAAVTALGATLPWYDLGSGLEALDGFDVPARFLVDHEQPGDGLKLGVVLVALSAAAFAARHRRGWERWTVPIAAIAGLVCAAFVMQTQRQLRAFEDVSSEVPALLDVTGPGVFASIVGAALMVWGGRTR